MIGGGYVGLVSGACFSEFGNEVAIVEVDPGKLAVLRDGRIGGVPDEYVIESWVEAPLRMVPEEMPGTFTKSVLDFSKRFKTGVRAANE